jgi:hypothetical protein
MSNFIEHMDGYMISVVSVAIIALYSWLVLFVCVLIEKLLLRRFSPKVCRSLLAPPALVLLALPWVEEAWIVWHYNEARKDAGVWVYRQVEVEGFYDETLGGGWEYVKKYGFKFMETNISNARTRYQEKVLHIERPADLGMPFDQWSTTLLDRPTARYHVVYAYHPRRHVHEEPIGWKLEKIEYRVIDSQTGEILGRKTTIIRVLPAHEALIAGLFGPPIVSDSGPPRPIRTGPQVTGPVDPSLFFTHSVLKPLPSR